MRANKKALIAAVFGAVALAAPAVGMAQQPPERGAYVGFSIADTEFTGDLSGGRVDVNERSTGSTYGARFQVELGRHFAVRVEWQKYRSTGGPSLEPYIRAAKDDIDAVGAGLIYKF